LTALETILMRVSVTLVTVEIIWGPFCG
jgi:hypothetical protein